MTFRSILFDEDAPTVSREHPVPSFFADLNLDQLVEIVTAGREQYGLTEFFLAPLHSATEIKYRHDVLGDLESMNLREAIDGFAQQMGKARERFAQAQKMHYPRQQQAWFHSAAQSYCDAVVGLAKNPALADTTSPGFTGLRTYLAGYLQSAEYQELRADAARLQELLGEVAYCVRIDGSRVTVTRYDSQPDYTAQVEATFAKFKQGAVKDYKVNIPDYVEMNHVEASILDQVARLYPEVFTALTEFTARHATFIDDTIAAFDREVQFYLGYLHLTDRLRQDGLPFCYPQVSSDSKHVQVDDTFDIVLADKLHDDQRPIVTNNIVLTGHERILVITGPNQGGKTTFARTFGQLHYLAQLGLPVPGRSARLFVCDRLFTHFEKEEDPTELHGKLEEDLIRIHDILDQATPNSIVVMNELFSSTTLADAILLGTAVLGALLERDCLGVCVTFVDELSTLGEETVSLVSGISAEDATTRSFKIERRPADGLSYAVSIAEKYGLTYQRLTERISR